jgi:hypothetical protein
MTILDDLDNEHIFAPHFRGDSWKPWRAFLAAMMALPMDEDELALYQRHTGRTALPVEPFTEAALVVGRRGGKSRVLALLGVYLATARDYTPYLAPGEVATVAVIAASKLQARTIFRYAKGLLAAIPEMAAMVLDDRDDTITLSNNVVIEIATASFRVTRGYTFAAVLADETAFWRTDDASANPDTEIFRAIRPGMGTIPGALLLNASSPYRRSGVLWTAYREHYGKDDATTLVWKATTREMNPAYPQKLVDKAYADDPEAAAAEYGAEFRTDLESFVDQEIVDACTEIGCYERAAAQSQGNRYFAFVDAAGGSGADSMTMAIAHKEGDIAVLDAVRERKPRFSPEDVAAEFSDLMKSYGVREAEADKWGGDWVIEGFRKHGVTIKPSAKPKSDIYRELLPLLNARKCDLLDHKVLAKQITGLERRVARGGRDSIDHAPGAHDDVANAVAGALVMAGGEPPPINWKALLQAEMAAGPSPYSKLYRLGV